MRFFVYVTGCKTVLSPPHKDNIQTIILNNTVKEWQAKKRWSMLFAYSDK